MISTSFEASQINVSIFLLAVFRVELSVVVGKQGTEYVLLCDLSDLMEFLLSECSHHPAVECTWSRCF